MIGAAGENVNKRLGQVVLRGGRGGSKWQAVGRRAVCGLDGKEGLVGRVKQCPGEAALFLILSKKFLLVNSQILNLSCQAWTRMNSVVIPF